MKKTRIKKNRSIMTKILIPVTLVFVLQTAIFICAVFLSGTFDKMRYDKQTTFYNQTASRTATMENLVANKWMNLDYNYAKIVDATEAQLEKYNLTASEFLSLEDDRLEEVSRQIIRQISTPVADTLRISYATGAMVVLGKDASADRYGLYLRDNDPDANAADNSDLTVEIAPLSFPSGNMMSSSYRKYKFPFSENTSDWAKFFDNPTAAYKQLAAEKDTVPHSRAGWWSPLRFLNNESVKVATYTVPLLAKDGTVLGVYGVDISEHFLSTQLPFSELNEHGEASYCLALATTDLQVSEKEAVPSGYSVKEFYTEIAQGGFDYKAVKENDIYRVSMKNGSVYCLASNNLHVYDKDTPFEAESWLLFSVIDEDVLFEDIRSITQTILGFLALAFVIGVAVVFLVCYLFSRPITALTDRVKTAAVAPTMRFGSTSIKEIDELTGAIEQLSSRVFEANSKFEKTIELTDMPVASFEYDVNEDYLFLTENFPEVIGLTPEKPFKEFSFEDFSSFIGRLRPYIIQQEDSPAEKQSLIVYRFKDSGGQTRWVEMRRVKLNDGKRTLGVINNVTASYREKETLLFERNFDALCGIYNRRAFSEKLSKLFENGGLGIGAFMMFDIDNLKYINDNYGHDFGDRYIQSAANSLVEKFKTVPKKIYGRRSGDEFYAFIYGYESLDEVKKEVKEIHDSFRTVSLAVTGGETIRVRVSGGVSLYPQDSADCESLMRFADFAMYEIKTTAKGELAYYDSNIYEKNRFLMKSEDLFNLLENELVEFHYQPIVSLQTGEIYGYEALMRSLAPAFKSPQDIFNVARYHYRLGQLEKLTFFKSIKDFTALGISDRRLFINSVPSQNLKDEEWEELTTLYGKKLENIVVEFTEYERASYNAMQYKLKRIRDCGAYVALDDYGTGYNGEAILLECFPDFVKIDILLVRNVDKDAERQKMISNLVEFAKARKMRGIAEGVETKEELETVIRLGCDFVQGYYVARPAKAPPAIPEKQQTEIKAFYQKYHSKK